MVKWSLCLDVKALDTALLQAEVESEGFWLNRFILKGNKERDFIVEGPAG